MWQWCNEKAHIDDTELENSKTWWIENSENHHAQHFTTYWAFSGILQDVDAYKDKPFKDGYLSAEHHAAWTVYLKEYLRQWAHKGYSLPNHYRLKTDFGGILRWFVLNDPFSPIIIETVRKKDFKDFTAFQDAILKNKCTLQGKTLEYNSSFYNTTLRLPTDASHRPMIDGTKVDYDLKEVYKSQYLNDDFGGDVITIQKGEHVLTLDFNRSD